MTEQLPPVIMTAEEIEVAVEESIELEREFLDSKKTPQPKTRVDSRMLRTPQAADYLGISEWKLRQMVRDGLIEYVNGKYWKFDRQSLDRWIEVNREKR